MALFWKIVTAEADTPRVGHAVLGLEIRRARADVDPVLSTTVEVEAPYTQQRVDAACDTATRVAVEQEKLRLAASDVSVLLNREGQA
jgi:hypothetical protein